MSNERTVALTVLTPVTPAILDGKPVVPAYWAHAPVSATLIQGPLHIHSVKPAPKPPPAHAPDAPPGPPFAARWGVETLPDPAGFADDFYWLGSPSGADGTTGIAAKCRQWSASTAGAPAWHSFFPFKPSVRAYDSFLPGGTLVHHPAGVHFNSHFIEHMWMDWGKDRRQPFTWVIAAMIVNFPDAGYRHYLLDAGRNPDTVHFPRLTADQCNTDRLINDDLPHRSLIGVSANSVVMASKTDQSQMIRMRSDAASRPKVFYGVFNGASSRLGSYSAGGVHRKQKGHLSNGAAQHHRYYVIGRGQGHIDQDRASHVLIFEIRFWSLALTEAQLADQYRHLAAVYQMDRYRSL